MVLNPTIDVWSTITLGGCKFQFENHIIIYLNVFEHCLYALRALQGEQGVTTVMYPPNISAFVDKNNRQIVTNFASVLFNKKVKALKHDGHIFKFRNFMIA